MSLNNIPIRSQGTRTIFIRDIGSVEDGADIQTGYALVNGHRTVYVPITKRADASTLAVVQAVKANLSRFQSVLPDDIEVSYQFDQSPYVTRAIDGLFFEGALGVVLTQCGQRHRWHGVRRIRSLQHAAHANTECEHLWRGSRTCDGPRAAGDQRCGKATRSWEAAIEGAGSRLRPILMTSCAMIAGMIPMALGLSEGGEQTAPLGRAVIGGLIGATCATLIILPAIFATLQSRDARVSASLDPDDPNSPNFEPRPPLATASDAGDRYGERHVHATE